MNESKVILWDFDGTLGYRSGRWSGALADVLDEQQLATHLTKESFPPFLREGFPWHRPLIAHLHLTTPELWWTKVENVLAKAYMNVGFSPIQAIYYARLAHYKYLEPSSWSLFDDAIPALSQLSSMGWSHIILSNHVPELAQIVESIVSPHQVWLKPSAFHGSHSMNGSMNGAESAHPWRFGWQSYSGIRRNSG